MNAFNLVHFNQHFEPTYRWVIDGLGKLIKDHPDNTKFATRSPEFAWTAYHPTIRSRAKLEFKEDGRVFVSLDIAESSKENLSRKNFKILPNIYYALRFKDENGAFPIHCCGFNSYHFHEEIDFAALNFWAKLNHDKSFFSEYCDDDDAVIEIYVAPPAQMEKVYSYDGSLKNLAVRNLFDLLPKTEDTNYYGHDSIYLYTAPRGYRVQVCFEKSPKDIFRVVILFAVGEFDRELIKFFIHRTSVTLVHSSLNAEKNVTKAVEKFINIENCSAYIINLCKWSNLRHFINDDGSIRFHLSIKSI